MTERLYYLDATLLNFDAQIIATGDTTNDVILDRSAFYPTSGGQPHDTGTLNGVAVIDVIDDGERVVHRLASPLLPGPVRGSVDAARRADYMQQHSAQHLLSALAADRLHWDTASVHFGDTQCSIEFTTSAAAPTALADLERWANIAVAAALPVAVTFEDAADATAAGLRKPSERRGTLRVVSIATLDRSACGGTHVATTSAIGAILLIGIERVRQHVRISFLAGERVLRHAHHAGEQLQQVAATLGCAPDESVATVSVRQLDLVALRKEVASLETEVALARVQALYGVATPGNDGVRRIQHEAGGASATMLRSMAQQSATLPAVTLLILDRANRTVYYASSTDSGVDAGGTLKPALAAVGGRGGGNNRMAQGSVPTAEALDALLAAL